ncbi:ComEA family DNA-binding protein [Microvirga solisilvae]|uniref:ComEA family DNA-binding protein n=1 Tax=Microvirga solisilvae TaxID=2919498 RepID=UPI001FB00FDA|nr:helix-hairpin-helix domain-containing protein [Microvirga solisilvae]
MRTSHLCALAVLSSLIVSPVFAQTTAPGTSAPAKPPMSSAAPAAPAKPMPGTTSSVSKIIDINTAPKDELDKLPQIGEARAEAIIKGRPYKAKDELVEKKIIPQSAYDAIKDRIIAHQKS